MIASARTYALTILHSVNDFNVRHQPRNNNNQPVKQNGEADYYHKGENSRNGCPVCIVWDSVLERFNATSKTLH